MVFPVKIIHQIIICQSELIHTYQKLNNSFFIWRFIILFGTGQTTNEKKKHPEKDILSRDTTTTTGRSADKSFCKVFIEIWHDHQRRLSLWSGFNLAPRIFGDGDVFLPGKLIEADRYAIGLLSLWIILFILLWRGRTITESTNNPKSMRYFSLHQFLAFISIFQCLCRTSPSKLD